jgi:NAD-dependent deacetylase
LKERIATAREWIERAGSITVLTGAGVSAESGVPTFRGKDGLWNEHRPEDLATPEAFARNRELIWEWYRWRQGVVAETEPNDGHRALARFQSVRSSADSFVLITQNVDGHHERAGSRSVVELHGNLFRAICPGDGTLVSLRKPPYEGIPVCPACGDAMRPDVVWFGESLASDVLRRAFSAAERADVFVVAGTSAVVHPAASLPGLARNFGAKLIEVNVEETSVTPLADVALRGPSASLLPTLFSHDEGNRV